MYNIYRAINTDAVSDYINHATIIVNPKHVHTVPAPAEETVEEAKEEVVSEPAELVEPVEIVEIVEEVTEKPAKKSRSKKTKE